MYTATSMLAKARTSYAPNPHNRTFYREIYLKSDHWKFLREEKLKQNPNCEKCQSTICIDVHHLQYRGLYDVKISDLQTLCRKCHDVVHEKKKRKRNRKSISLAAWREKRLHRRRQKWLSRGGKLLKMTARNLERQKVFDRTVNWRHKDMNNYVSIHY
jgi:5-methylcytosine-specific restriction endonuclease McrA